MLTQRSSPPGDRAGKLRNWTRPLLFKYYIHDGVEACRLQLLGELTQAEICELNGCWNTVKTTLGSRKLILDLTGLKAIDHAGREWIAMMSAAGAIRVPDNSNPEGILGRKRKLAEGQANLFSRLLSIFRGSRTVPAGSTTQAQ